MNRIRLKCQDAADGIAPEETKKIKHSHKCLIFSSAPLGARTLDTLIKGQVLYQLS